jgi:hypothetical protein
VVAFEAKLSPMADADDAQAAPSGSARQFSGWSSATPDNAAAQAEVKPETVLQANPASYANSPVGGFASDTRAKAAAPDQPEIAREAEVMEAPSQPAASRNSLNLNISGGSGDPDINVRLVDRGGEIHVSVRTPDAELAQDLRTGLNDLVGSLQHAGMHTEVSGTPAVPSSASENEQQTSPDSHGSGRQQPDSEREQNPRDPRQARWEEVFEESSNYSTQEQTI